MQLECRYVKTLWPRKEEDAQRTDFIIAVYRWKDEGNNWQEFVAKGSGLPTDPYLNIVLDGEVVTKDSKTALEVKSYQTSVIKSRGNVLGYLSSGVIKGVGSEIAKRIVDHFGIDAIEILQETPERLMEVGGIGPHVLEQIIESFSENKEIHGLMEYLGQYKISPNKAKRIVNKFGARSLEVVRGDIYHLCQVDGFGFLTVDAIAQKMGHQMKTYPRVLAGCEYLMEKNHDEGHLYAEYKSFLRKLQIMLNKDKEREDRYKQKELEPPMLEAFVASDKLTVANGVIYLTTDYHNEITFAAKMAERLVEEHQTGRDKLPYPKITGAGIRLSDEQEHAVAMALTRNTCIITGGPGTGKTTVLNTFLKLYRQQFPGRDAILLCAPTGRAARRMSEATNNEAFTIHRAFMLGSEEDGIPKTDRKLDLVVVDEFSMCDQWISTVLLTLLKPETKLVMVGDVNQLPSVGPGDVLRQMIQSEKIPVAKLIKVFRQAAGSSIAENAKRIIEENTNLVFDDDFIFVETENQAEAKEYIVKLYDRARKTLGADQLQILSPLKVKGECSVINLNTAIQQLVQENREMGFQVGKDSYFCIGDPVIQIKNKNGINNGDMGVVTDLSPEGITVKYPGMETPYVYKDEELRYIELAYSLTVHKSQGGEYPLVIIPVLWEHLFMLIRNLLYTGVTRGKFRVVLVGSKRALQLAITEAHKKKRNEADEEEITNKRNTFLAKRIAATFDKYLREGIPCGSSKESA